MKGVIIYKSRYGSTKQYAEWLQEETGFDLFDVKHSPSDLSAYDVVVIGSSILASRAVLGGWIRKHWASLQGKAVYLLLVNVTADQEILAKVVPQSVPAEIAAQIRVFPVGGRYLLEKMAFLDRTMIKMVSNIEKRPEVKAELLADRDWVKKDNLQEILAAIRGVQAG